MWNPPFSQSGFACSSRAVTFVRNASAHQGMGCRSRPYSSSLFLASEDSCASVLTRMHEILGEIVAFMKASKRSRGRSACNLSNSSVGRNEVESSFLAGVFILGAYKVERVRLLALARFCRYSELRLNRVGGLHDSYDVGFYSFFSERLA